ncbi:hypothetical protein HMI49_11090 [Corallococcus exercitus]|uniref:LamG domain-containing protein n=1 Tax=Corallococcus exercitus TaxID=2316736 RepID=A0A7Y4NS15_9BACT|nr:LamG-like jellyroll fold domain-containing protein [Corallococcus exercitus]NOK33743.1 hypothetical protein [Corallococcus exercitus]
MLIDFKPMRAGRARVWSGVLAGCLLLPFMPAQASEGFADDFETGTLLPEDTPPGRWDDSGVVGANTLTNGAAGAHRGRFGLTVVDRATASGSQASIHANVTPLTSEVHVRTWLRMRAVGAVGSAVIMQGLPALVELRLLAPGPGWELSLRNGASRTYVSLHGAKVEAERWSLVELRVRGLGTASAEARLWVDGVEQGSGLTGLDLRDDANVVDTVMVGEPWSDTGTFTGSLDFDDVRVSNAPMASRLELRRPVTEGAKDCLAVDLSLRASSTGAPAPAPYDADVALAVQSDAGRFHADADCDSPVTRVVLPTGASERRVYFRPQGTAGTVTWEASHADFLPASLTVDVEALPSEDNGGGPWTTDLGCTSAPGAVLALPALLGVWLRRRRAR